MASSSLSPRHWTYDVFPSFRGEDVRSAFLSHFRYWFHRRGIMMFVDENIEKGQSVGPELKQAIRESRISIVLLSKNYAASSWCLDELLEIMNCREIAGQTVMTIFYGVNPTDVRKQTGDFGKAFEETCDGKTEKEKKRWKKALADVANIAGDHSAHWY